MIHAIILFFHLFISLLDLNPQVTVSLIPSGVMLYEGAHVTLKCTGTLPVSVPGVTVSASWTGPVEQQLTRSDTLNVSQTVMTGDGEYQSTVVIFPSSVNDSGLYTCTMNTHTIYSMKPFSSNSSVLAIMKGINRNLHLFLTLACFNAFIY